MTAVVEDSCAVQGKTGPGGDDGSDDWQTRQIMPQFYFSNVHAASMHIAGFFLSDKSCFHTWFVAFNAL